MTIGIGITTFQRPEFCEKSVKSLLKYCSSVVDHIAIVNDGSSTKYAGAYKRVFRPLEAAGGVVFDESVNRGCAWAKNRLIDALLPDCDWIFLVEDDIRVLDAKAITEYVRICEETGNHHLSFAHHGPANHGVPLGDGDVSYFPHSIGAWTIFSRECLKAVGFLDESFVRAWEHVEHELRLIVAGFMPGAGPMHYPDATHSQDWLEELPNSIEKSSIRPLPDWFNNVRDGLQYWRDYKRDTFDMLFGPGKPLNAYANQILGIS